MCKLEAFLQILTLVFVGGVRELVLKAFASLDDLHSLIFCLEMVSDGLIRRRRTRYLREFFVQVYQAARGTACGELYVLAEIRAFFGVRSRKFVCE